MEEQIDTMKKYVTFTKRAKMRNFLQYSGYFRASRYGKYLLSYTNVFLMKPSQDVLFALYQFDFELRKVMYEACAKAEIQIKSAISNAVSLKTDDAVFYLDKQNYTPTRSDLRKEVLLYSYSRGKYGKKITMQMDTWLNGVRTLRNICAHHSRLVGMQEAIVLSDAEDDTDILLNGEDFFSRLYALKKVMNPKDSEEMKSKLKKIISRAKIDVYQLDILPVDWEDRFDRIKYL